MYMERYNEWAAKVKDKALLKELKGLEGNLVEIENRFYKDLEFGTGGLRGILGAGANCMNIYTVGRATQGIANYMRKHGLGTVAVSYDSRILSREFAEKVCGVFAANGIKCFMTKELMPTPFLSFSVRENKADIGVMVTASHNPSQYNGYKAYGPDGCQITSELADAISSEIAKVSYFGGEVKAVDFDGAVKSGMTVFCADGLTEKFLSKVQEQSVRKPETDIAVVYTALNGAGYKLCPEIMRRAGVKNVIKVGEQCVPDGTFKTCPYPNPEYAAALELGIKKLKETGADILLASDPDADRMGVVENDGGEIRLFTGNEIGVLLTDFILSQSKNLPKNPVFITTIVSTTLTEKLTAAAGAQLIKCYTGFKNIGEQILRLEKKGEVSRFVFGFEESYGYTKGSYVRDKDAVQAVMLLCELKSFLKGKGLTLLKRLESIYKQYGWFRHQTISYDFPGAKGFAAMSKLIENIRANPFKEFAGLKVVEITDYMTQAKEGLPKENVILYKLEKDGQFIVRPSGTEPKLKVYLTAVGGEKESAALIAEMKKQFDKVAVVG